MSDLLLMSPPGLPRTGLVALYDPYRDAYGLTEEARLALQTGQDYSGRGNTLTYGATTGASFDDPTNTGTAWSFDGGDFLGSSLAVAGGYTVVSVLAQTYSSTGSKPLFSLKPAGGTQAFYPYNNGWSNSMLLYLNSSNHCTWTTPSVTNSGSVNFVAVTLPGAAQADISSARLWFKGVEVTTKSVVATGGQDTRTAMRIGNAGAAFFAGGLYFFSVYNRVLTDSEISRAYRTLKGLLALRGVTLA